MEVKEIQKSLKDIKDEAISTNIKKFDETSKVLSEKTEELTDIELNMLKTQVVQIEDQYNKLKKPDAKSAEEIQASINKKLKEAENSLKELDFWAEKTFD